jgi:Flp pilus assembly protein TadG
VVRSAKRSARKRAQALVEFAFILPVLLIIVLGSIEIGRAFVFGVTVQDAARQAARLAANARVNPGITDANIVQRLVDTSSPAMLGCTVTSPVTSTPVTFNCGGGTWTITMTITPAGSGSTYSTFSAVPASSRAQLNGGTVEVKAAGSVSLLAGFTSGWNGMALYQINVQGDAIMVMM